MPVSNKTRTIISFSCDYDMEIPVQFYARPSDLYCYPPILDATKTKVKLKCETKKIYPPAVCVFLNELNQSIQGNVSYSLQESYSSPGYYRSDCSLEVIAQKLISDHYNIQCLMYPNLSTTGDQLHGSNVVVTLNSLFEPPVDAPKFVLNDGLPIIDGVNSSQVSLSCNAEGGFPAVSSITISCLGRKIMHDGNALNLVLDFKIKDDEKVCTCSAYHVSERYANNISSLTVVVFSEVQAVNFSANNNVKQLDVLEGDSVTLKCTVQSNPEPEVDINIGDISTTSHEFSPIGKHVWQSTIEITNLKCGESKHLICLAKNNFYPTVKKKHIEVTVKCPLQFLNYSTVEKIKAEVNTTVVIQHALVGYPSPNDFQLYTMGDHKISVDKRTYNVEFKNESASYGTLTLTLPNVQKENWSPYNLVIKNGVKDDLTLTFILYGGQSQDNESILGQSIGGAVGAFCVVVLSAFSIYKSYKKFKSRDKTENKNSQEEKEEDENSHDKHDGEISKAKQTADMNISEGIDLMQLSSLQVDVIGNAAFQSVTFIRCFGQIAPYDGQRPSNGIHMNPSTSSRIHTRCQKPNTTRNPRLKGSIISRKE